VGGNDNFQVFNCRSNICIRILHHLPDALSPINFVNKTYD
jgi:hypothetical protein